MNSNKYNIYDKYDNYENKKVKTCPGLHGLTRY